MKIIYTILISTFFGFLLSTEAKTQVIQESKSFFNLEEIYQIKFSNDGNFMALNYRNSIRVCNAQNQHILHEIPVNSHTIEVGNKNSYLAYGNKDGQLSIVSLDEIDHVSSFPAHNSEITCIRFSNDDSYIATTGMDQIIKIWSIEGKLISELSGHEGLVTDFQFSLDDKVLISCSADKSVKIWDYNDPRIIKSYNNNSRWLRKIAISPDGITFATAGDDRIIHIYSLVDYSFYKLKKIHVNLISDIKFYNENYIISIGHDQKICLNSIHIPNDKEVLDFFKGNPIYRHYFKGVRRNYYFTSFEINHHSGRVYISTLGNGIVYTPYFHNFINKPHDIFINLVDDYVIDSSYVRKRLEVRKNPFKIFGSVTRPENIDKAYVEYVADEKKTALAVTNKYGKFMFQGIINEHSHEYKILIIDKDPHLPQSEYYFKAYRHKNAKFPESLIPPLPQ